MDEDPDEEDTGDDPKAEAKKHPLRPKKATMWDLDVIFAYRTFKIVRIKDRWLGFLYWAIVLAVILYLLVYVFGVEAKHQYQEPGIGTVLTRFKGKAFSGEGADKLVFDGPDLRWPIIEPSGAFIMTKQLVMRGQTIGKCINWDTPKRCPCAAGETCVDEHCSVQAWCPSLGDINAPNDGKQSPSAPPAEVEHHRVSGLENAGVSIMSGIAFPGIGNYFFTTGASEGAENQFKNVTVGELLALAEPPVSVEDVIDTGALLGVSFFWNCDVDIGNCEPAVIIKRLDSGQGFSQKRARHYREGGVEKRDAMFMYGIRIIVDSAGIGKQSSLVLIVMQIGAGLALLRTAAYFVDYVMLSQYVYAEGTRNAYSSCKIIETKDYSDLKDRINLIQDQKEQQHKGHPLAQGVNTGAIGLGPGARGGQASSILRGRAAHS